MVFEKYSLCIIFIVFWQYCLYNSCLMYNLWDKILKNFQQIQLEKNMVNLAKLQIRLQNTVKWEKGSLAKLANFVKTLTTEMSEEAFVSVQILHLHFLHFHFDKVLLYFLYFFFVYYNQKLSTVCLIYPFGCKSQVCQTVCVLSFNSSNLSFARKIIHDQNVYVKILTYILLY